MKTNEIYTVTEGSSTTYTLKRKPIDSTDGVLWILRVIVAEKVIEQKSYLRLPSGLREFFNVK